MSTFFLKNLPKKDYFRGLARRYRELDPTAVETLMVLLRASSDIIAKLDQQMAKRKMSQGRYCVLMQLNVYPEAASPSQLADRIGVTRATITGLLDGLERDAFVRRERAGADRRSFRVVLTARGREHLERMIPGHYRRLAELTRFLTERDRAQLRGLVAKLTRGMDALEREDEA
jgi:DNA-binding MarR family transcriptional regulator